VVVIDSMSHRVPLGIVNEHSICEQVVAKGRKLRGLTAGGVLDSSIKKIPATANVEECSDIFQGSSRAAVVVDQKGGLCGLLTAASLPAAPASTSAATSQRAAVRKSIGMIEIPAFGWVQ
jgi:predicted transcriptional regulator